MWWTVAVQHAGVRLKKKKGHAVVLEDGMRFHELLVHLSFDFRVLSASVCSHRVSSESRYLVICFYVHANFFFSFILKTVSKGQ